MAALDVRAGETVYLRSFSTRRTAIAQVIGVASVEGQEWVRVRLVTDWYDWDRLHTETRTTPRRGEELLIAPNHLEAIRR